jgi:inhibitor of cysteine peptidase
MDLTDLVRYQSTTPPSVFVNTTSPHMPAMDPSDTTLTESDNGSDVSLAVGDVLRVQLAGNPSTGFVWTIAAGDDTILAPVGEPQFELGSGTPMPGAGGTQTFTFRAVAAGETTLTLVYMRPWETDATPTPENTFSVNVTVE